MNLRRESDTPDTISPAQRFAARVARLAGAGFALAAAAFALFVFEAASKTGIAYVAANTAARAQAPETRTALLGETRALLETSWARPTRWHAGAVEALSWIQALEASAAGHDRTLTARSAEAAAFGVSIAPIQPTAWARLAALGAAGYQVGVCDVATCLERSWMAARMTDFSTACTRIRLANRLSPLQADDPRLTWFAHNMFAAREMADCLGFLPPPVLMRLLVERNRAARGARATIVQD